MRAAPDRRPRVATTVGGAAALAGAGLLTATGFPPVDRPVLGLVGVVVALGLLRRAPSLWQGAAGGLVLGLALFAAVLSWSGRFGLPAYAALVLSQALFVVPVGLAAAWAARHGPGRLVVTVAAVWTLAEAARARWPLGGLEWGQLGYVWHGTPLRRLAASVGVLGLTGLTVAVCAGLAVLATTAGSRRAGSLPRRAWLPVVVAATALPVVLLASPETAPAGELDVTVVQVAPVCDGPVARCPDEDRRLLAAFASVTREVGPRPDLLVWGEGALGGTSIAAAGRAAVSELAPASPPLLAGVTAPAGPGGFVNANVLFDATGSVVASYLKRHPVPFGEFVPLRALLGGIGDVAELVPADLRRGTRPGRLAVAGTVLGTVSSFETSFAREVRAAGAAREVGAVVVLTNESSYGRSAVSEQLLAMAQLRAAELGKPVLVAATTGRSASIAADGELLAATRLLEPDVLRAEVRTRSGTTWYGRVGDAPVVAVATLLAAAAPSRLGRPAPSRHRAARRSTPRTPASSARPAGRGGTATRSCSSTRRGSRRCTRTSRVWR
jgi:apolipoprotein N-acyltransferase